MATKKKTVKKPARKASKKTKAPAPAGDSKVVDPAKVVTLTRGRGVIKYVELARRIEALKDSAGITYTPTGVKDVVRFRSSLIASLKTTFEHLKLDVPFAVATLADKSGFLITRA